MRIAVCVKQVPDTWAEKAIDASTRRLDRQSCDVVPNELDDYALEQALIIADQLGAQTVVITMGPERSEEMLRRALSMGIDEAVHVNDAALQGSDAMGTSRVLAKVLTDQEVDIVLFGSESTDARMSVIPVMVAERLGWPALTHASSVEIEAGRVVITRSTDTENCRMAAYMPAVVSVLERINTPRYPSFKGIMAAKKKAIMRLDLVGLGIPADDVGDLGALTEVISFQVRPPKAKGHVIHDDGQAASAILQYLLERKAI